MQTFNARLDAIHALPLTRKIRVLNVSADQERVIALAHLQDLLPENVELIAGPGSAASVCPATEVYQAVRLCMEHDVTLAVDEHLLFVPGPTGVDGPPSLAAAREAGADVRVVSAPVEAVQLAVQQPGREVVLFAAGFETLLAPLAGMLIEGLPDNLSMLLCGRRVQALLPAASVSQIGDFDAVLLPGNRGSLLGLEAWERVLAALDRPGVIAGYTAPAVLAALYPLLQAVLAGKTGISNCYRPMVKTAGNPVALQRLTRVFAVASGSWRGIGSFERSAYRLRGAYERYDADRRFPDYRPETVGALELRPDCDCAAVITGNQHPAGCGGFNKTCQPDRPSGPCMGALDGTCRIHSLAFVDARRAAPVP
jgi:hydrogenase expression/formation protein HypD